MDEKMILDALLGLVTWEYETAADTALAELRQAITFSDAGLLTYDRGLVLRMADGTEFQLTVRQSK
jgi:hypothetical protein